MLPVPPGPLAKLATYVLPAASTAIALGDSSPVADPPMAGDGTRLPNVPAGYSVTVLPLALVTKTMGGPEAPARRVPMMPAAASRPASATNIHADVFRGVLRLLNVISPR